MRIRTLLASLALAFSPLVFSPLAGAQAGAPASERIEGLSPGSRQAIELFEAPAMDAARRTVPAAQLSFPMSTSGTEAGFYRIEFEGRPYWVRTIAVRVRRQATDGCVAAQDTQRGPTGSTPGAAAERCAKPAGKS